MRRDRAGHPRIESPRKPFSHLEHLYFVPMFLLKVLIKSGTTLANDEVWPPDTGPSDGMTNVRPDWSHQRTSEVQPPSCHRRRSVGHGPAPRGLYDVITPRSVSSLSLPSQFVPAPVSLSLSVSPRPPDVTNGTVSWLH